MARCQGGDKKASGDHSKLETVVHGQVFKPFGQQPDAPGSSAWETVADCLEVPSVPLVNRWKQEVGWMMLTF